MPRMGKNHRPDPRREGARAPRPNRAKSPRRSLAGCLLAAATLVAGCAVRPDIRVEQILNREGFGHRYTGDAAENYFIGIGDGLAVMDVFNTEINSTVAVRMDGKAHLPLIGDVPVAGLTPEQLEEYLNQRYTEFFRETDIAVQVISFLSKKYYVFGQVNGPGIVQFQGDMTLLDAMAGRWMPTANLGKIRVIRADPNRPMIVTCSLRKVIQEGNSRDNIQIHEDDIIYVPPTVLGGLGLLMGKLLQPFTVSVSSVLRTLYLLSAVAPDFFDFGFGGFGTGRGRRFRGGGFGFGGGFVDAGPAAPGGTTGPKLGFGPRRLPRPSPGSLAAAGEDAGAPLASSTLAPGQPGG